MFIVFFADDTWFLLNLFVQSLGYYVQWVIQLGFHTDAFAQLGEAPDGKEAAGWMGGWTIFYCKWHNLILQNFHLCLSVCVRIDSKAMLTAIIKLLQVPQWV